MSTLSMVLAHLESYLNDQCALQDFEQWLVGNLQKILDSQDIAAMKLTNQVDATLIELSAGVLDEVDVRQRFDSLVRLENTVTLSLERSVVSPVRMIQMGTDGPTIMEQIQVPGLVRLWTCT